MAAAGATTRPRLTAKVIRGLWPCISLIDVNLESIIVVRGKVTEGTDLVQNDATPKDRDDIATTLTYLRDLARWYNEKRLQSAKNEEA